ncbi:hypothetical protein NZK35_12400 [Stieleria sp. ICT_E10.1]|uniref:SGNH/GDSL hydrolase family protein n=1 Tax=Stieleria sedimenti TaxID=2976331 RepID=UPI00218070E3|nr:SGNH/GDSL hydrolase family protein [Stieleria sedimenti]MCS7467447.1 hypothetical protein [Stieleria sedimenti]
MIFLHHASNRVARRTFWHRNDFAASVYRGRLMLRRWIVGMLLGTLLVAATSPWFVRSYVPRIQDPTRGVAVLQPGSDYRWRSEGYATTRIGPMGMPGRGTLEHDDPGGLRLALWGDSQAEGVCVKDREKIAAQVAGLSSNQIHVFPFARSGDDCNDWIAQIATLRNHDAVRVDAHVFLLVEWSDWTVEIADANEGLDPSRSKISATIPAFLIQAVRNIVTTGDATTRRRLRFRPGPVKSPALSSERGTSGGAIASTAERLSGQLERLRRQCDAPCIFVYAPLIPAIIDGETTFNDPDQWLFDHFRQLCSDHGLHVLDARDAMTAAARAGDWPRGFHNGQFGVGHYNATGNRIIAEQLLTIPVWLASGGRPVNNDPAKD